MKLTDFVCADAIIIQLQAQDRDGVIKELVGALEKAGRLEDGKAGPISKAVIKRENEASTGIGKGIALPHVKHKAVKDVVAAVGKSSGGIDFDSLDKQPVFSVILLVSSSDDPDRHLQAMECVFKHLQKDKFRKFLRQSQSAKEVQELLEEADENETI